MGIEWSRRAKYDLVRLYEFLAATSAPAAARMMDRLTSAPEALLDHPRRGALLEEFLPREVRRILVGDYELRYEVRGSTISIVAIFHTLEDR